MEHICIILIAILLAFGLWRVTAALLYHDKYSTGRKSMQQIGKWYREKQDIWDNLTLKGLVNKLSRMSSWMTPQRNP